MSPGLFGLTRRPIRPALGRISCSSSIRLATRSTPMKVTPVTFPPGRLRLGTKPARTGSEAVVNTMGIVFVACIAALIATSLAPARMTLIAADKITRHRRQPVKLTFRPSLFDGHVAALDKTDVAKTLVESDHAIGPLRRC